MWTAISLWLIVGGGALAYVAWAAAQVGGGASVWPYVVGLPLVYLALILVNTSAFFALAWLFRAQRPDPCADRRPARRADGLGRVPHAGRVGATDDAVQAADAGPGARAGRAAGAAGARRAVQRRRVDADEAAPRGRGPGPGLRAVLRPAARLDRGLRRTRWRRRSTRFLPRPARDAWRSSRTAWAGSSSVLICAGTAARTSPAWSPSARRTRAASTRGCSLGSRCRRCAPATPG